jgi:transcriptional regulator with XRE-family HTH domain
MSAAAAPEFPADDSFGRRLRRERERRQIAIASIAENSKIKASLFEDLERDDASRWPSGVFRRAFIRAYAEAIGLDADATSREFLERFPDPNDPDRMTAPTVPPQGRGAASGMPAPSKPQTLRLTLEDTGWTYAGGRLLASARSRCAAIGCDAAIVATLGVTLYAVLGTMWMPLCVALAGYYAGGILLLGNTPGVCLCASSGNWRENNADA